MRKHRIICLLLALFIMVSLLPASVLADDSTTTFQTAYKDLSANTEIYAVSMTKSWDYPYYGAKWEPTGGVLYGRTDHGGTIPGSTRYGLANIYQCADESIISHYYGTNDLISSYYNPEDSEENNYFTVHSRLCDIVSENFPFFPKEYIDELMDERYNKFCEGNGSEQE